MSPKDFMIKLQEYYGTSYNAVQGPLLRKWVESYPGDLSELFSHVIKGLEFLPRIAALEKIARGIATSPRDDNALPPPPRRDWRPLNPDEQAEVEKLLELIPGYRPSGIDFTPDRTAGPGAATLGDRLVAKRWA
jgi:hypothetical protein